ncbi:selenium binding [Euphorbia peplus]|nr:selenium binding [Euphorbia peplus]
MAPRKRKAVEEDGAAKAPAPGRVTRSSSRLGNSTSAIPELPAKKKGKAVAKTEEEEVKEEEKAEGEGGKKIVIEHCKQCNSFKTRANQVKGGLENGIPGITVVLNPEKPRKGCFEIREEGGETFISLLDMKRPFKPMKDLDMEKVITDIVDKIKP